ncbi:LUD domain-containing protein [Sulfurisphaera ohwakuensis]|uniref:L-lactate dehydrogenase complex protein LldG n=1 Tax=Sulfurisphaera ohwakuensis TaxID=69656 RepID=A0A650CHT3_SULOH|nr:lactate utilization protein B [Sulfurisphaera ohwakuensis]MBB5253612.1 L-lactate dehydrogenase complex protein LldG [Sulfurisphaera ohwakuensis]QGR17370.1 lactate utilization protein [Sulfurisphaera ohwakuensis]
MSQDWEIAIQRTINNNVPRVHKILENHKYILDLAKKLREAKMRVLSDLETYVEQTLEAVKRTGGNAYFVNNAEEAKEIVGKIVGKGKIVVFGKSMVAYELGIRKYLQQLGNEVWETDLGEFLIQLADEPPSHIIAPAVHMTKERVAKLLKEKLGFDVSESSSHEELVQKVREFLRNKFLSANVGITGANAVAADVGSIVLVENEGNIRMSTVVPPVHIAIVGVEKIVPTLEDALIEALVQAAYAGLYPPTYINVTSGPSSTGDIEMKRVSPAHGPKEFHLILVDNGRLKASKDPILREALLCIRCGRCHLHCPIYRVLDGSWGDAPYSGPMGAMWSYIIYNDYKPALYCTHSGNCKEVCPMKINIPRVLEYIKYMGNKQRSDK